MQEHPDCCWASAVRVLSPVSEKIARAWTGREYSEQLSHRNIEGRRKFGCKSQRGALDGARLGVALLRRGERCTAIVLHCNAPHPHPHCNRAASVVRVCARARRCAYIRNHANVMRMRCSCGPWRLVPCRWRLLQPRPVRAPSGVHPGQASTSLITKDSVNDPANYIFRAEWARWPCKRNWQSMTDRNDCDVRNSVDFDFNRKLVMLWVEVRRYGFSAQNILFNNVLITVEI